MNAKRHSSIVWGPLLAAGLSMGVLSACSSDAEDSVGQPYDGEYTYQFESPLEYFSQTFTEADDKFVQACGRAGGRLQYMEHRLRGSMNERLRAVVCHQNAGSAERVLLTISGVHGIEGFAGSAMQIGMLLNPDKFPLPPGWRAVHLHMVNPYGASWVLKENEDNADQLKNSAGLYAQDIDNPILVEFIDSLNIPALGDPAAQAAAQQVPARLAEKYGPDRVAAALKLGQGKRPLGIGYFGPGKSWSSEVSEDVVRTYMSTAKKVVVLDFHTAVGSFGTWTVLASETESLERFKGWLAGSGAAVESVDVPSGAKPFYEFVRERSGAEIVRAAVEAGTYPDTNYQAYFVLNFYCRYFEGGWSSDLCKVTQQQIREYFYPASEDWKTKVWSNFVPFMQATLNGVEGL